MKKTLALVLCLLLAASIAVGCNKAEPEPEVRPVRGNWAGDVYSNEFLGVKFTLAEDFSKLDDAALFSMMGIETQDAAEPGAEYTDAMMAQRTTYEFFCPSEETGATVSMLVENLTLIEGGTRVTPEVYFEAMRLQLEDLPADTQQTTAGDVYDATLSGNAYKAMELHSANSGTTQYYYARRVDDYMVVIIINEPDGAAAADIRAMFS